MDKKIKMGGIQLALGNKFTAAPVHYHQHAMSHLLVGKKKWYMWPVRHSYYSNLPFIEELNRNQIRKEKYALKCIQNPGDIIYVPHRSSHSTMNLGSVNLGWSDEISYLPRNFYMFA